MNIVLGITGGIAAYKACEVVRLLVQAGHDVLLGKVKKVEEKNGEWRVTLETGTSTVVVERSRIIKVGDKAAPQA